MLFFFLSVFFGVGFSTSVTSSSKSSNAAPQPVSEDLDLISPVAGKADDIVVAPAMRDVPVIDDSKPAGNGDMSDKHVDHADSGMDHADSDMDHANHDSGMEEKDHADSGMDHADSDMDHADHEMDHTTIDLPQTSDEIEAFVQAIRTSSDMHSHDHGSSMATEHMAALDLVARDEATHIAVGNGAWDDPATWYKGEIPDDNAKVLIPDGVHVTYGHVSDAELFTVRVDGHLEFSDTSDSQLIVDTFVVSPMGELTIGTIDNPIPADVNVDIIFANNGPIDTDWDPMLLSRGMIAHGEVNIHGAVKDSHEKVIKDPEIGDRWVDFAETPEGWQVGDTIVIAGTHYEGYHSWEPKVGYTPSQDEIRVISSIEDGRVFFDEPLEYDHDTPRADLKTSVANYTRNVSFETEDAETAEIFERAHVMFMHNDDVDVRYAEFHELGRTDKSEEARNVSEFEDIAFDSNVKGRYAFHFHRAGMDDLEDPGMAVGNAVYGSPGWGFVHHDSNAILDNNATYDTFGAGYVAESGNETGAWTNNIAIYAQGNSWKPVKATNDVNNFDLGQSGDGFWFQGRMVESHDNIAASTNHGFVYFHRGPLGENGNIMYDPDTSEFGDIFNDAKAIIPDTHPILGFDGNEAFASRAGLHIVKGNPNQGHDVHSVLEDFTAWGVRVGAELEYTSHYIFKDFDLTAGDASPYNSYPQIGLDFGTNVSDMTVVGGTFTGFERGINLTKKFVNEDTPPESYEFTAIDATFIDVDEEYQNLNPTLDTILTSNDLPNLTPDITLDGPLTFYGFHQETSISGTKTDSLGETKFPAGTDNYDLDTHGTVATLEENGYYATSDGQNYFLLDIYFSDRVTGDIFYETHPVFMDEAINVKTGMFASLKFNGIQDLDEPGDTSSDAANLWASLTDGHFMLEEDPEASEEDVSTLVSDI